MVYDTLIETFKKKLSKLTSIDNNPDPKVFVSVKQQIPKQYINDFESWMKTLDFIDFNQDKIKQSIKTTQLNTLLKLIMLESYESLFLDNGLLNLFGTINNYEIEKDNITILKYITELSKCPDDYFSLTIHYGKPMLVKTIRDNFTLNPLAAIVNIFSNIANVIDRIDSGFEKCEKITDTNCPFIIKAYNILNIIASYIVSNSDYYPSGSINNIDNKLIISFISNKPKSIKPKSIKPMTNVNSSGNTDINNTRL